MAVTQYYIIEIKQLINEEYEHQVYYAWDQDPKLALLKAESKYHEILSAAAVSTHLTHSCEILSTECVPVMFHSYKHPVEPEPEPESEPEPTPEPDGDSEPDAEPETPYIDSFGS